MTHSTWDSLQRKMYNPKDTSVDLDDVEVGYLDYSIMGVSGDIRYEAGVIIHTMTR